MSADHDTEEKLLAKYGRRLNRIVRQYPVRPYFGRQDLLQEAKIGLITAYRRYDPSRGPFWPYACYWIRHYIQRALARNTPLKVPIQQQESYHRLVWLLAHGYEPAASWPEKVWQLTVANQPLDSLDVTVSVEPAELQAELDAEESLAETLADPYDLEAEATDRLLLEQVLSRLSLRERIVLTLRYGLDGNGVRTFEAIGGQLGISRNAVHQIHHRALQKARAILGG